MVHPCGSVSDKGVTHGSESDNRVSCGWIILVPDLRCEIEMTPDFLTAAEDAI